MGFAKWNERLFNAFFGEFAAQQPVRLNISRELLDSEFIDLGGALEFGQVVRKGPAWPTTYSSQFFDWTDQRTLIDRALGLCKQWKHVNKRHPRYVQTPHDAPPYFPYLFLLCYAWTTDVDGVGANNFYDRLEQLYPSHGLRNRLVDLHPLWEGLEDWSKGHKGRFGVFKVEQLGGMAWVGIPKSQVIFTAARLEALPQFFGQLGLTPESHVTVQRIRALVGQHEQVSRNCLGISVTDAIAAGDDIGNAALEQLLEHLASWDGQMPEADESSGTYRSSGSATRVPSGRLVVALRPDQNNERWRSEVHFSGDDMPNGLLRFVQERRQWSATVIDGCAGPFHDEAGGEPLRPDHLLASGESLNVSMKWSDEVDGETEVRGTWRPRKVFCLQWRDGALVDQGRLPSEGDVYVLVDHAGLSSIRAWISGIGSARQPKLLTDLPQSGLPDSWRLAHISGIGALRDYEWGAFPYADSVARQQTRILTLRGGTRARRTSIRRVYAAYDPPKVVVEGDAKVKIRAVGSELEEITREYSLPSWLPLLSRPSSRAFRLMPLAGTSVITVTATNGQTEVARITFALARSADSGSVETASFTLNAMGEPQPERTGAFGLESTPEVPEWTFFDGPYSDSDGLRGEVDFEHPGHIFLEWLANRKQVPFARARDFAFEQLATHDLWSSPNREARALSLLAHLEIKTDTRGRWSSVHAAPAALYALPLKRHGLFQAVLGGTYTRQQATQVVQAARDLNLQAEIRPQSLKSASKLHLVPPRLCLVGEELEALQLVCEVAKVAWYPVPPAWAYAYWSARLDDWTVALTTFPESGSTALATYRPCEFRTCDGDQWPAWGCSKLVRFEDQVTRRHFQYTLVMRRSDDRRHAFVSQRAWGTWFVHRDVMLGLLKSLGSKDEFKVPIAYSDETRAVAVPFELELPLILARSLTLCSGLAPELLTPVQCGAYSDNAHGFTPGRPYHDNCLAYLNVPEPIAKVVLDKLGATPKMYPPLPKLEFRMG